MHRLWGELLRDDSGQGLVEYALIIALMALGLTLALTSLRNDIRDFFGVVGEEPK